MSQFWAGDYQTKFGNLIVVRVRAKNQRGWGKWSSPNTEGVKVARTPEKMPYLYAQRLTERNAINVTWSRPQYPANGGSFISNYNL